MALDVFKWCVQVQDGGGTMSTTNNDREVVFGNGFRQKGSAGFNTERREFQIVYVGEDFADVREFLRNHRLKPFAFTPPNDRIGIFTMKADTLTTQPVSSKMNIVKCSIVEEFTVG